MGLLDNNSDNSSAKLGARVSGAWSRGLILAEEASLRVTLNWDLLEGWQRVKPKNVQAMGVGCTKA